MAKLVKRAFIGIAAVVATRRIASLGIVSAAAALVKMQRSLDDAATPVLRPVDGLRIGSETETPSPVDVRDSVLVG